MTSIPASREVVVVRSPEGIELEMPLAGPASRVAAYAIDSVLVWVMIAAVFVLAISLPPVVLEPLTKFFGRMLRPRGQDPEEVMRVAVYMLVLCMVIAYFGELLYFSACELLLQGRTPGKYFMRLRVIGAGGEPPSARSVLLRNALRAVDVLPASYAFGLVSMLVSQHGQRLGDHAAGTLVVRTDRHERPRPLVLPADLTPLALSREQLERLGDRELALLRTTLRRVGAGTERPDLALATQVAQALVTRLKLEQSGHDPVRLLQELLLAAAPHESAAHAQADDAGGPSVRRQGS